MPRPSYTCSADTKKITKLNKKQTLPSVPAQVGGVDIHTPVLVYLGPHNSILGSIIGSVATFDKKEPVICHTFDGSLVKPPFYLFDLLNKMNGLQCYYHYPQRCINTIDACLHMICQIGTRKYNDYLSSSMLRHECKPCGSRARSWFLLDKSSYLSVVHLLKSEENRRSHSSHATVPYAHISGRS